MRARDARAAGAEHAVRLDPDDPRTIEEKLAELAR